jgi:hypothetical protein
LRKESGLAKSQTGWGERPALFWASDSPGEDENYINYFTLKSVFLTDNLPRKNQVGIFHSRHTGGGISKWQEEVYYP